MLNYLHEPYCSFLWCAILVLNANVRVYAKSPKWHKSYFVARTYVCICSYQKSESTVVFLFYFLIYMHSTNTLYLQLPGE